MSGENYLRDVVFADPDWDGSSFAIETDLAEVIASDSAGVTATDPDLYLFVSRGGKLLLWHGWTDGLIPPRNTIDYYEHVANTLGVETTSDAVRLFMAPGVNHCGGGEGPSQIDFLGALERWVEDGIPPERILAAKPLEEGGRRTRPVCAYPKVARYAGTGSPDDADSFTCVTTEGGS
jgi:feruloyl esterase